MDFINTVGGAFYTADSFIEEARRCGISRRLRNVPEGLLPGSSRVYCVTECGRDSAPRKCTQCDGRVGKPVRDANGIPYATCTVCGARFIGRVGSEGRIFGYFVPDRIEVVLRVTEEAVLDAVESYRLLGIGEISLAHGGDTVRAIVRPHDTATAEVIDALQSCGASPKAVTVAANLLGSGAQIALVGREPLRGCGRRVDGGIYAVGSTPFVTLPPGAIYHGQFFRGFKRLSAAESAALTFHEQTHGGCSIPLSAPTHVA